MTAKPNHGAVWTLEPHTAVKHALLRHYLDAWFPILGSRYPEVVFIDGFAGPGIYANGEPGSPILALRSLLDRPDLNALDRARFLFHFNEMDPERHATLCTELEAERAKRSGWPSNVMVAPPTNLKFTELTKQALAGRRADSPTFAFVDPFGYGDVPMCVLADLATPKSTELFIYFDYNSVQRFATANVVDPQLELLFGTKDFALAPPAGTGERKQFVYNLYKRQLHDVCKMPHVQGFEMVNLQGKTGSYLFFCTRNMLGFDKMKSIMWRHAPMGDFRFRDRLAGMEVMMSDHVDTEPLKHALLVEFSGQSVPIETVEEFVVAKTPFVTSHLRAKTLRPMQASKLVSSPNQKKPGTFPEGTIVTFAEPVDSASVSMFDV